MRRHPDGVAATALLPTILEVARLTRERDALDGRWPPGRATASPGEALKRRAELVRQIERAETEWLTAAEAIESEARLPQGSAAVWSSSCTIRATS